MAICGTCNGYVTLQANGRPYPHNRLDGAGKAVPCTGGSATQPETTEEK